MLTGRQSGAGSSGRAGERARRALAAWAVILLMLPAAEPRQVLAQPAVGDEPRQLAWEDLLPPGETERLEALYRDYLESRAGEDAAPAAIPEGGAGDFMPQIGTFETVTTLDGQLVRMPGFVVPLDFSQGSSYDAFLLVPYFGACIHTPPPPPNQLVYVTAQPAATVESIWEPVWVVGRLHARRQDTSTGNAAYTLDLDRLEPYDEQP